MHYPWFPNQTVGPLGQKLILFPYFHFPLPQSTKHGRSSCYSVRGPTPMGTSQLGDHFCPWIAGSYGDGGVSLEDGATTIDAACRPIVCAHLSCVCTPIMCAHLSIMCVCTYHVCAPTMCVHACHVCAPIECASIMCACLSITCVHLSVMCAHLSCAHAYHVCTSINRVCAPIVCTPINRVHTPIMCAHLSVVCAHLSIVCAHLPCMRTTLHSRERLWILTTPTCMFAHSSRE